jgi:hypothetical protein
MRHAVLGLSLALSFFLCTPAAAQEVDEPTFRFNAAELSIGGRVQTQLNTSSVDGVPPSELLIRRARLELAVEVSDRVSGVLVPDFAGDRISLKDAYLDLALSPAARLRAGNMKRPFGLLELTSSKRMPVIERGVRIRGLNALDEYAVLNRLEYSDRDVGLQLHGEVPGAPLSPGYAAGVFRGPLHGEVGAQDSYQFAARATIRPLPTLRLGAGWSAREFTDSIGETPELRRGDAFEVDVEYGAFDPGIHVLAELSTGELDPFTDARFRGGHLWLAYRTGAIGDLVRAFEPVVRISRSDLDDPVGNPASGGTLITPGLNVYVGPNDRIMLDYDVWRGEGAAPGASSFKAMLQLAF